MCNFYQEKTFVFSKSPFFTTKYMFTFVHCVFKLVYSTYNAFSSIIVSQDPKMSKKNLNNL